MRFSAVITLVLLIAAPAYAAGSFGYTVSPITINASPGDAVDLPATLRNTGDATLYVNDVSVVFNGQSALYLRLNPFFNFFNSVPGTFLSTDQVFTGSIQQILVDPGTPSGYYSVTVEIIGGPDPSLSDRVNSGMGAQSFTIAVGRTQPVPYSVPWSGGMSITSQGGSGPTTSGYGSIQPSSGNATPSGLAILEFRENNVLVTEASVPASPLVRSGRIYADVNGPVNTGIAIANPTSQTAIISCYFTNANGNFGNGTVSIPANAHIAAFLDQAPFNSGSSISGSFTFNSSVPVAAVAIRGLINERGEFLITTLPMADLAAPAIASPLIFPDFADGGGWTTQIVLVNPGDATLAGTVQFLAQAGSAAGESLSYSIPPRSSQRLTTAGTASATSSGSVRVAPAGSTPSPSGLAILSYRNGGVTVTEVGVPAVAAAKAFRLYAEESGTLGSIGSIQTGIAVANMSAAAAEVTVEVTTLDGSKTGLLGTLSVPPNGQIASFLNQIPGLGAVHPIQGVVRVSSNAPISVTGLRGRYNERRDFLVTATPSIDEAAPPSGEVLFFPQIVDSGGYTTEFILFSGPAAPRASGTLFLPQDWILR